MSTPTPITIRKATLSDLVGMTEVTSQGFMEFSVLHDFLHPKRREFPTDWHYYCQKQIRTHLVNATTTSFVAVDESESPDRGRIAALCIMDRLGKGVKEVAIAEESFSAKEDRARVLAQNALDQTTWTDRSLDPDAQARFERNWVNIKHHFDRECWFMECLCVHPDYQGKRVGIRLLNTAIELAESRSPPVAVGLISTAIADEFYRKHGFVEVGRANVGETAHLNGGSIKFYERHLKS